MILEIIHKEIFLNEIQENMLSLHLVEVNEEY